MIGNLYIKGNLYLTDDINPSLLKKDGLVVHVAKDVIFKTNIIKMTLSDDDVFIDNLFDKLDIQGVIAYSTDFDNK